MVGTHRPRLRLLSGDGVEQILDEAFLVLARVGVRVENGQARELLADAGARIGGDTGDRVWLPEPLVRRCLATIPASFTLFDRQGSAAAEIGGGEPFFVPGSAALRVHDFEAGAIRTATSADVVRFVALTDALEAFALQSTGVVPGDVPEDLSDRYRLFLALALGSKPIITGTFTKAAFGPMKRMLEVVRGGERELAQKPLAVFDCCPSPPLSWSDLTAQALIDCARSGIPAELVSAPLAGATAPVTLAGTLVQHAAENLSGAVIHQLASPGAPLVYGGSPFAFDMRTGTAPLGAVETMMMDAAYAQIGERLGMPVHAYIGLSDAKSPDAQAGLETAMGMTLGALSRVDVISGGGMLDFENCQSLEKLVLDAEIASMTKRLLRGIDFREQPVGVDVLAEAAVSGRFLVSEHTRRFFRDEVHYPSPVIDRGSHGQWQQRGRRSAAERAHDEVARLHHERPPALLDDALLRELEDVVLADARAQGAERLPDWRAALPTRRRSSVGGA